jgi:predicted negative regulator of RcsB-dependent stress response
MMRACHEHVGDLYDRQGKKDQARPAWQKALFFSTQVEQSARLSSKVSGDTRKQQ